LGKPPEIPQLCSILSEAKVAVTPMDGRLRFGGTMEVGGNDLSVNPDRVRGIVKSVASYFPNFRMEDFDGVPPWAGLRPVTPDGIPYIGRVKTHSNLIVAAGHAMMGLSMGPVTGQVVSDLLTGDDPFRSIESMSVSRF
jgi:D-amino-acid dehydrogenase